MRESFWFRFTRGITLNIIIIFGTSSAEGEKPRRAYPSNKNKFTSVAAGSSEWGKIYITPYRTLIYDHSFRHQLVSWTKRKFYLTIKEKIQKKNLPYSKNQKTEDQWFLTFFGAVVRHQNNLMLMPPLPCSK